MGVQSAGCGVALRPALGRRANPARPESRLASTVRNASDGGHARPRPPHVLALAGLPCQPFRVGHGGFVDGWFFSVDRGQLVDRSSALGTGLAGGVGRERGLAAPVRLGAGWFDWRHGRVVGCGHGPVACIGFDALVWWRLRRQLLCQQPAAFGD